MTCKTVLPVQFQQNNVSTANLMRRLKAFQEILIPSSKVFIYKPKPFSTTTCFIEMHSTTDRNAQSCVHCRIKDVFLDEKLLTKKLSCKFEPCTLKIMRFEAFSACNFPFDTITS